MLVCRWVGRICENMWKGGWYTMGLGLGLRTATQPSWFIDCSGAVAAQLEDTTLGWSGIAAGWWLNTADNEFVSMVAEPQLQFAQPYH